jgi:hypothetical protein
MTFYDALIADADADARTLVRVDRADDRAVVTLDDPDRLNVLSASLTSQLRAARSRSRGVRRAAVLYHGRVPAVGREHAGPLAVEREEPARAERPGLTVKASCPHAE